MPTKIAKTVLVLIISLALFSGLPILLVEPLTKVNPNYVVLEDGRRGYVMNTENMFYSLVISFGIVFGLLIAFRKRIKQFVTSK